MELEKEIIQRKFHSEFQKAVVNILYTFGWLNGRLSRLLKSHRITLQQFNVLRILRGQHPDPASVNLLIERMLDKSSNASRLVERLRQKGLVQRLVSKNDRRQVDVFITKKGLNLLTKIDKPLNEFEKKTIQLSEKEAKVLNQTLDKLRG